MPMILVYRYRAYDVTKDEYVVSTRMATPEQIARIGAEIIPGTALEISDELLRDGWTKKFFNPN